MGVSGLHTPANCGLIGKTKGGGGKEEIVHELTSGLQCESTEVCL